ncbi:MAG: type II secretion system protein M [Alphaproteobacteria bacterium]|nr:type II secretion system protein M [Alphaproteobacteria bacterium]
MFERIRAGRTYLSEQFEAMPPRDRWLAVALAGMVALVLVGGVTYVIKTAQDERASQVTAAKENLRDVQGMAEDYALLTARLEAAEARMGQFRAGQINTYISQWAAQAGLSTNLQGIREGSTRVVGGFRERTYTVEINDGELGGLVRFLYALETSPYPIRVHNASFKAQDRRDARPIDLDLELRAYTKEEG